VSKIDVFNNLFNVQLGFVEANKLFASSADPKMKHNNANG